ncbi:MAG: hypothetical protein R3C09_14265 [Pirellulaceae bacterium]
MARRSAVGFRRSTYKFFISQLGYIAHAQLCIERPFRQAADPGNKTDQTDWFAQHRAAVAGFGLCEPPLGPLYHELHLRIRHRRDLVGKSTLRLVRHTLVLASVRDSRSDSHTG